MRLGIIGLPLSGKTTVFNALTRGDTPTTTAATGKLETHTAIVDVPDARVDRLSAMFKPRKTIYAKVTYTDFAGLEQGIGKTGLTGQLRNQIATTDAFVLVIRGFENSISPHPLGSVNPQRDLDLLHSEFMLADLVTAENRIARIDEMLHKGARSEERVRLQDERVLFERLHAGLEAGLPLRDLELTSVETDGLAGFGLLSLKPTLVLLSTGEDACDPDTVLQYQHRQTAVMALQGKLEMELAQLPPDEATMFMEEFGIQELGLDRVIHTSYGMLGLCSFFTVGEDEVRAWTLRQGSTALDAAAAIHTDLARGFIRAEVVGYEELIALGGMVAARKVGKVQLEGKEYLVRDGDIVHIRFSL
ncbi:MAG: Ribosome-binding ATPase YchF [Chloroflexi bacterium ADurb.Bin360]|nr:MAG: Ribosome-binding ATPase YchF [Chloroflexi bacterium ADurb.Bin360]